jgi:hypothetical protein
MTNPRDTPKYVASDITNFDGSITRTQFSVPLGRNETFYVPPPAKPIPPIPILYDPFHPPHRPTPLTAQEKKLIKTVLKVTIGTPIAALALYIGGNVFMHTAGRDIGLMHYYNTLTDKGMAQARGDRVSFDPKDTSFQVTAKDTCLHTKPRNRSLVEICFRQGTEVRGEILTPADKNQKPEWLTVKAHNAGGKVDFWTTYIPLKDLKPAPVEPKAKIKPTTKKLQQKPTP